MSMQKLTSALQVLVQVGKMMVIVGAKTTVHLVNEGNKEIRKQYGDYIKKNGPINWGVIGQAFALSDQAKKKSAQQPGGSGGGGGGGGGGAGDGGQKGIKK